MSDFEPVDVREVIDELIAYVDLNDPSYATALDIRNVFDIVETIAGRKPVFMLRGFQPDWGQMLMDNYPAYGLEHIHGPIWDENPAIDWPSTMTSRLSVRPWADFFVLSMPLNRTSEVDEVSMEQEAELLAYPVCCVRAYYARHRAYAGYVKEAYLAASGNDADAMADLIDRNVAIPIDPRAILTMRSGYLSPVCSFAYCDRCRSDSTALGPLAYWRRTVYFLGVAPALLRDLQRTVERGLRQWGTWEDRLREFNGRVTWRDVVPHYVREGDPPGRD